MKKYLLSILAVLFYIGVQAQKTVVNDATGILTGPGPISNHSISVRPG